MKRARRALLPTIVQTMKKPALFARWFKDIATWSNWVVLLSALFGLPLDESALVS
jgi:hypothetical protein